MGKRMGAGAALVLAAALWPARTAADCDDPDILLFGMNVDPANPGGNPSAADLQALGARWVRVEYKQHLGFGFYDGVVGSLRAGGIRVLLLVDYSSVSAGKPRSDAGAGEWASYRAAFVGAARDVAAHYRDGVDAWEVWNESDLMHPGEPYDPGVPEAEFGPLLRDAGAAIRESSSRPLVVGGLASGDAGYYSRTVAAAGGSLAYDAVGLHPYGQRAPDGWPDPSWGFGDMTDIYDRYLAAAGGLPLWITEVGTEDLPHQADYLRNVYALTRDSYLDRVPVVLWFCWSDAMVGHFGVLDAGGSPKDSYRAYADVAPDWDPACGATTTDADADADADAPLDGLGADDADVDAPLDGLGAEDADAPLDEPGAEDDGAGALDGADDVCDDGARDGISFDAPGWDGTAPADGGPDSPAETPSTPDDGEATGCGCAVPGGPSRAHLVLVFAALALSALHRRNGPPRRGRSS